MPLYEVGSLKILHLSGSHKEMGIEHGRLLASQISENVREYMYQSSNILGIEYGSVRKLAQNTLQYYPPSLKAEIEGIAIAANIDLSDILAVNSLIDAKAMLSSPFHCCNFVLTGAATRSGETYHGRNIDFPAGGVLNRIGLVIVRVPQEGVPTIAISWPAHVGILTGCNSASISMGEVGVPDPNANVDTIPFGVLSRSVLEECGDLAMCLDSFCRYPSSGGFNVALCDGQRNESISVELSTKRCEHRSSRKGVLIVDDVKLCRLGVRNQLISPTGAFRYARMRGLITENYGHIDENIALSFLSDNYDVALGKKNRRSYNCIANYNTIHSVLWSWNDSAISVAIGKLPASSGSFTRMHLSHLFSGTGLA